VVLGADDALAGRSRKDHWVLPSQSLTFLRKQQPVDGSFIPEVSPPRGMEDYFQDCTCACCEMQHRKPSEIVNFDAVFKCSRSLSGTCSEQDQCLSVDNEVLSSNTHAPLVYDQFCQLNCQPFDEAVSGACIRLSKKESGRAETDDGNGEDMHLPPQRPKVQDPFKPEPMPEDTASPCEGGDCSASIYRQLETHKNKAKEAMEEAQRIAKEAQDLSHLR